MRFRNSQSQPERGQPSIPTAAKLRCNEDVAHGAMQREGRKQGSTSPPAPIHPPSMARSNPTWISRGKRDEVLREVGAPVYAHGLDNSKDFTLYFT